MKSEGRRSVQNRKLSLYNCTSVRGLEGVFLLFYRQTCAVELRFHARYRSFRNQSETANEVAVTGGLFPPKNAVDSKESYCTRNYVHTSHDYYYSTKDDSFVRREEGSCVLEI